MTPSAASGLSPVRAALDNGAVVIVQETSTTPAVAINATFLAGSVHEPADLTWARVPDRPRHRPRHGPPIRPR